MRQLEYYSKNFLPTVYHDKIYRKEMLPSRVRYNAFFFYAGLVGAAYFFSMRKMSVSGEDSNELADRRYFTADRAFINPLMIAMNSSAAKSNAAKQTYIM